MNSFTFNGENLLQCGGTDVGMRLALSFANLSMGYTENNMLANAPHKTVRYIDDIFIVFKIKGNNRDIQ